MQLDTDSPAPLSLSGPGAASPTGEVCLRRGAARPALGDGVRGGAARRPGAALAVVAGVCLLACVACSGSGSGSSDSGGNAGNGAAAAPAASAGAPADAAPQSAAAGSGGLAAGGAGGETAPGAAAGAGAGAAAGGAAPAGFKLGGDATRGRQVYAANCATCHGDNGDGKGEAAGALEPKPTNFTDARVMHARSDWQIYRTVRDGGPAVGLSPGMAGYGPLLSDADLRSVAAFVRTLAGGAGAAAPPPPPR